MNTKKQLTEPSLLEEYYKQISKPEYIEDSKVKRLWIFDVMYNVINWIKYKVYNRGKE